MTDNIINFSNISKKVVRERPRGGYCRCSHLTISEHERTLYCEQCGKHFDVFDYLLKMAKNRDFAEFNVTNLNREAKELSKKIQELKREERNIKNRLKRATEKENG